MTLVVLNADADAAGLGAPAGQDGYQVELSRSETHIIWRLAGNGYVGDWQNLVPLLDIRGLGGPAPRFVKVDVDTLAPGSNASVAITGTSPELSITFSIPKGKDGLNGADGRQVQLRATAADVEWRLTDGAWSKLVALADLKGPAGPPPTLAIGNVTTKAAGAVATAEFTATGVGAYSLDLGIPQGVAGVAGNLPFKARSANTQIAAADLGTMFGMTGSFTQTFASAAALGVGFSCYMLNLGQGDITLDPNGSETIDGLTSFVMYPGEARLIQGDGTALRSVILAPFTKTFLTSGTFIKPPGYRSFSLHLLSGSSGGGGASYNTSSTYGGSSATSAQYNYVPFVAADTVAASVSVLIGAAGAAGTNGRAGATAGTKGEQGGDTSFGTAFVASAPNSAGNPSGPGSPGFAPSGAEQFVYYGIVRYGRPPGVAGRTDGVPVLGATAALPGLTFSKAGKGGNGGVATGVSGIPTSPPTAGETGELVVQGVQ